MPAGVESQYRRFLLATAAVTYLAAAVELVLVEHYADVLQAVPFVLIAAGLTTVVWAWASPTPRALWALRVVAAVVIVGSVVGVGLHVNGNLAFALEIRPSAELREVLWEGASGGNPLLAPGMVALAAVLAAAAAYRHPNLTTP